MKYHPSRHVQSFCAQVELERATRQHRIVSTGFPYTLSSGQWLLAPVSCLAIPAATELGEGHDSRGPPQLQPAETVFIFLDF